MLFDMLQSWMRSYRHIIDISTRLLRTAHIFDPLLLAPLPYPPRSHGAEDEEKTLMSFDVAIDASLPQPADHQ
jgi:hypothetical protein